MRPPGVLRKGRPGVLWGSARTEIQPDKLPGGTLRQKRFGEGISDLFPYAWTGYFLIHIPLLGWVGAWLSAFWLGSGALVSLYLACRLFQRITDVRLAALGLATCYGWSAAHAPYFSFAELVAMSLIAFALPRPLHDPDSPADALARWKRS